MNNKLIIFGGTFDPFTKAHFEIVKQLYKKFNDAYVIIAPTITNWYREQGNWLSDEERINCINVALKKLKTLENYHNTYIWTNDINTKELLPQSFRDQFVKNWHFIDTLIKMVCTYGNKYEYSFVIGSDQLKFFKKWYRWKDILELANMIVVNGRNGKTIKSDIPHVDITIPKEYLDVSATQIRNDYKNLKNGFSEYLKTFDFPEPDIILNKTPIFNLVKKPAPFKDQPDFHPVGINSKDWVCVICKQNGLFLTVNQLRFGLMKKFDEFPCGMVENEEKIPLAAARELREETGYVVDSNDLKHLGSYSPNPAFMNNHMHYYFVDLDNVHYQETTKQLDDHERLTCKWVSLNTFIKKFTEQKGSALMGCALYLMKQNKII